MFHIFKRCINDYVATHTRASNPIDILKAYRLGHTDEVHQLYRYHRDAVSVKWKISSALG